MKTLFNALIANLHIIITVCLVIDRFDSLYAQLIRHFIMNKQRKKERKKKLTLKVSVHSTTKKIPQYCKHNNVRYISSRKFNGIMKCVCRVQLLRDIFIRKTE